MPVKKEENKVSCSMFASCLTLVVCNYCAESARTAVTLRHLEHWKTPYTYLICPTKTFVRELKFPFRKPPFDYSFGTVVVMQPAIQSEQRQR